MRTYFRHIASKHRNDKADRHLAYFLIFVAGAANAGGFMAVQQYTSHMSGIVSAMADNVILGDSGLVIAGAGALGSFIAGAATSAILINWGRRLNLQSEYAFPLVLEAILLIIFGLLGVYIQEILWFFVPLTVSLLCFIMGLQNAIITKLSESRMRTTHVTGIVTDIGIEIGKLLYWNGSKSRNGHQPVRADRKKLRILSILCGLFFFGGIVGAYGFKYVGFSFSIFLGIIVFAIAIVPVMGDLRTIFAKE